MPSTGTRVNRSSNWSTHGWPHRNVRWQRDRFDELVRNTLLLGSPEFLIERITALRELGFDHLIFRPGWLGMPTEKVRASLRLFAAEVFPAFRSPSAFR